MGVVYEAVETELDRTVALKVIAPEHTPRPDGGGALQVRGAAGGVARAPATSSRSTAAASRTGSLYLAMRYVPGTNLRKVIDHGPMDLPRVGRVVTEIADALDAAHARGLVHRDVKPGEHPAHRLGRQRARLPHRLRADQAPGIGRGTSRGPADGWARPTTSPPSRSRAAASTGAPTSTRWAACCYEMLTGHVAFPKDSDMAKLWAHVTDPPPLPRSQRPDLVDGLRRGGRAGHRQGPRRALPQRGRARRGGPRRGRRAGGQAPRRRLPGDERGDGAPFAAARADEARRRPRLRPSPPPGRRWAARRSPPLPRRPPFRRPPSRAAPPPSPLPVAAAGGGGGDGERRPRGSDGGASRRGRAMVIAGIALVTGAAVAAAIVLLGSSSDSGTSQTTGPVGQRIAGNLGPVPTNHVSGAGDVELRLSGDVATVTVDASGLLDGARHPLHIHAGAKGVCPSAQAAHLHNGHRTISTLNGVPWYGSPVTALTSRGDTSQNSILALRRYPSTGAIRYTRTIRLGNIITSSQDDYTRYQQAHEALRRLRLDANKRDILRQQRATHHTTRVQIDTQIQNWHDRLAEVTTARQRIVELAPLVERQSELEHQRDTTSQQVQRYQDILVNSNKLKAQNENQGRVLEQCQQKISAIEPLVPVAQLLEERTEHYNQLRIQSSQREEKQRQLQEKRALLKERQAERPPLAEQLRKAEKTLDIIEEHRSESEEMPTLQQERERLEALEESPGGQYRGLCTFTNSICWRAMPTPQRKLPEYSPAWYGQPGGVF